MGGNGQVRPRSGRFAVALFFGLTLFSGCAPIIPEAVRRDVDRRIPFAALRQDPDKYRGRTLLLGGDILRVAPGRDETELELLERPLDAFDRPGPLDASGGRFLVRHPGFLDSAIYAPGRTLTVAGRVTGAVVRPIGEAPYRYPVLEARAIYLWPLIHPEPLPPARWPYWWSPFWPSARPGWHRYPYWW